MVGVTTMVHAVWWLECVWASTVTAALLWHAPSMMILVWPMVEDSLASFLWRWSKILFLVFRRPTAIRVDVVYFLGVTTLIVIVASWPRSFVMLGCFSLWLELAEMQDLGLAEFSELFVQLHDCFRPLLD
jgi:hypothetical protein